MNVETKITADADATHFDVLIVGAGISGIDAAYHLQQRHPGKTFALLECEAGIGGTWRIHKYPGIRSDSDLYTFGYSWKPWMGKPIAEAHEILSYLEDAIVEQDISQHIRFGHEVCSANWSEADATWSLQVAGPDGERTLSCNFLWMCQGYYRHDEGYTPEFTGRDRFQGQIVHPQTWPEDIDLNGKRVAVIGSGATAATLVPAIADRTEHVIIIQRSPTYYFPKPDENDLGELLAPLNLPDDVYHQVMRKKYLYDSAETTRRAFEEPDALAADLIAGVKAHLEGAVPLDPHFTPSYQPWRQRLAVVPNGDLFAALKAGTATILTDKIETFDETGIQLASGTHVDADVIVTATGLNLAPLGDIPFTVNGKAFDLSAAWAHHGIMFTGLPNLAYVFGYIRTSWTMRADLVADFVCRVLERMDATGTTVVEPQLRAEDQDMAPQPLISAENFNAGYIQRSVHLLAKQGDRGPWVFTQDYQVEKDTIPAQDLEDGTLSFR